MGDYAQSFVYAQSLIMHKVLFMHKVQVCTKFCHVLFKVIQNVCANVPKGASQRCAYKENLK